jgi:hypothetical protein
MLWRATESFWGWLALFLPDSGYIIVGFYKVLKDYLIAPDEDRHWDHVSIRKETEISLEDLFYLAVTTALSWGIVKLLFEIYYHLEDISMNKFFERHTREMTEAAEMEREWQRTKPPPRQTPTPYSPDEQASAHYRLARVFGRPTATD